MNLDQARNLALKYIDGTASEEEKKLLHDWYDSVNASETEIVMLDKPVTNEQFGRELFAELQDAIASEKKRTVFKDAEIVPLYKRRWFLIASAAILISSLGVWTYFLSTIQSKNNKETQSAKIQNVNNDALPGGNKAVLTLSNGSKIILDSAEDGTLAQQGKTNIIKLNSGLLSYNALAEKPTEILYNTITTPKGGQYEIILSDSTHVWLNAASSLHFPTSFTGTERNVELSGEGYFEVAKNQSMPFHVTVSGMQVEVLGTHFNVMAYTDEATIKTTLLEGKVKITKGNRSLLLKPGDQAQLNKADDLKLFPDADLDEAVGWKKGFIKYNSADIQSLMRQAARWYDVEVVYEGAIPTDKFSGKISRSVNLSQWLRVLELSDVHFKIEGKKIIVRP